MKALLASASIVIVALSLVSGEYIQSPTFQQKPAILHLDPEVPAGGLTVEKAGFDCHKSAGKTRIQLTVETNQCLDGELYPNNNINILREAICADGSPPTLNYYLHQGCGGTAHPSTKINWGSEGACFWSGPTKEWSLMFSCDVPDPALKEQSVLPISTSESQSSEAVVATFSDEGCMGDRTLAKALPDKQCLATAGRSFQIRTMPLCANGTRPQWARFEDTDCGGGLGGKLSAVYGLLNLTDWDLGKCHSTGLAQSKYKIRSMAFLCDGFSKEEAGGRGAAFVLAIIGSVAGAFVLIVGGLYVIWRAKFGAKIRGLFAREGGIAL